MIAATDKVCTHEDQFLKMLPQIRKQAKLAFRNEPPSRKRELVAEVIANCWVAFVRLVDRGLIDVVYPSLLTRYAIKQVRDGRRVGARFNVRDVSSEHCQRAKGVKLESLGVFDDSDGQWQEVVVEDKTAGPAEVAATRIDFSDWLGFLPTRHRRIAKLLATGESTGEAARRFGVSHGRISQVRRELFNAWRQFQGGDTVANQTAAVTS